MFPLRQLLNRFVAACNAMAYAHSRGVLHRDLKPDNIMLGPYGETLVVDWGLAKLVGRAEPVARAGADAPPQGALPEGLLTPAAASDTPPTELGAVVGTPAYMSPEQAAGLTDQLGPATDIYGLGATLYCLLTGEPPFAGQPIEHLWQGVIRGRFTPPRKVNPQIPPTLEAICLKAMRLDPQRRYASARDLADDLEAWLADEPVRAWREPLRIRVGRWLRRHRSLVTGVLVSVFVALLSLSVGVVLLTAAKQREEQAKLLAQTRGEEALHNYKAALRVVNTFCTKVGDDPRLEEHGLEWLQEDLLDEARAVLEQFVEQKPDDRELVSEAAFALVRLEVAISKSGSKQRGVALLEKARYLFDELVQDAPESLPHACRRAKTYLNLGVAYGEVGKLSEARTTLETARQLNAELLSRKPQDVESRVDLAHVHGALAGLASRNLRFAEAEAALGAALALYQQLTAEVPDNKELQFYVARTQNNLGVVCNRDRRYQEALDAFTAAQRGLQPLAEEFRLRPDFQQEQLTCELGLGTCYRYLPGRTKDAAAVYRSAIQRAQRLVERHPGATQHQSDLAAAHADLAAVLLLGLGEPKEAAGEWEVARKLLEPLAGKHPHVPSYQDRLIRCLGNLACVRDMIQGDKVTAEALYREVVRRYGELLRQIGEVVEYQQAQGEGYANLGRFLLNEERPAAARESLMTALQIFERLDAKEARPELHVSRAEMTSLIGRAFSHEGQPEEGLRWAEQALKLLDEKSLGGPAQPLAQEAGRRAQASRAEALSRLGRHAEALAAWQQVVAATPEAGRPVYELGQAEALARAGRRAAAIAPVAKLRELAIGDGQLLCRLAALYATAAASEEPQASAAEHSRRIEEDATAALALLEQARAAGYFQRPERVRKLAEDPAWKVLRGRDDFDKFLRLVQAASKAASPQPSPPPAASPP
jgi:serine/threonine-protein kinase